MIDRASYKAEVLLRNVALHVRPTDKPRTWLASDGVYYIGGGYWRAAPILNKEGKLQGLRLINPSRTAEEIACIERAVCLLTGFEYKE